MKKLIFLSIFDLFDFSFWPEGTGEWNLANRTCLLNGKKLPLRISLRLWKNQPKHVLSHLGSWKNTDPICPWELI